MRLKITWEDNPAGTSSVLPIGNQPVCAWLTVDSGDDREPPQGQFSIGGDAGAGVAGGPNYPHFTVTRQYIGKTIEFRFDAEDNSVRLTRRILVVRRSARVISICLLSLLVLIAGFDFWVLKQVFTAAMPDFEFLWTMFAGTLSTALAAVGIQLAGAWSLLWRWKLCLLSLLPALLLLLGPQFLLCRFENATGADLELSPTVKIPPGGVVLVKSKLGGETWGKGKWLDERLYCSWAGDERDETCERRAIDSPWWGWVRWFRVARVTIGCDVGRIPKEYDPERRSVVGCKPSATLRTPYPRDFAQGPVQLTLRPAENVRSYVDNPTKGDKPNERASVEFGEYRHLELVDCGCHKFGSLHSDFTLVLPGKSWLEQATIHLGSLYEQCQRGQSTCRDERSFQWKGPTDGHTIPIPNKPIDRILVGAERLGEVEIGKLTCVLDDKQTDRVSLGLVESTRRIRALILMSDDDVASSFEVTHPELATAVPLCRTEKATKLEVFLAESWQPGKFQMQFPSKLLPKNVEIYFPDGRFWGSLECPPAACSGGPCKLETINPATDQVVRIAQYTPSEPGKTTKDSTVRWTRSRCDLSQFANTMWTCGARAGKYSVTLGDNLARELYNPETRDERLIALPQRACLIDPASKLEVKRCPNGMSEGELGSAKPSLKLLPLPDCSPERSRECK